MSTIRDPAYITNAGRTMMTAGGEVTYTKAVMYGQDISGLNDSQIKALTSLGNPLREVKIGVSDKQSTDSGSTVILEAVFQNNDLKADLQYKAVGFFARKNDVEQLVIVAVANQGAYLAATNPDGVATDALDLKIAVKIGDATSVTAVIDPAGSVTPATLNSAIKQATQELTAKIDTKSNSQDVQNALNLKANKSTVEDSLATKANVTDLNNLSSEVAKKANSDDVTTKFSDVDKSINAVSDTVTKNKDAIDKQIASLTTTVNAKVDASYSYSREELDKKFLALSVSADGKMSAEQVSSMIATKADKSYVDEKLDEKADKSSVDEKINAIDFSKIKFRKQYLNQAGTPVHKTWSATKNSDGSYTIDIYQDDWTASKVASLLQTIATKADKPYVDEKLDEKADKSSVDARLNAIDFSKIGFTKQYITNANGDTDHHTWFAKKQSDGTWTVDITASNYGDWTAAIARNNKRDIASLQSNKADSSDVYTKKQIDDTFNSCDTRINNAISKIQKIDGETVIGNAVDVNTLEGTPNQVTVYKLSNLSNTNTPSWIADGRGVMIVLNYDGNAKTQIWTPVGSDAKDSTGTFGWRYWEGDTSIPAWNRFASLSYVQNLVNQQAQTIKSLTARLTTAESKIQYMQDNYIEGKRFPASQESQANSWENEKPTRLAMIEK